MNTPEEYYKQQIEHFFSQKEEFEKRSKHFSMLRLVCFLALAVSVYQCFVTAYLAAQIFLSVLFVVVFLWMIKRHDKIQKQKDWAGRMLFVNKNELDILAGKPSAFDNGASFFSTDEYYYDLDIFGKGSVYHLLNRTGTSLGAVELCNILKQPFTKVDEIKTQQQAVSELSTMSDLRQQILAAGMSEKGKISDLKNVEQWIDDETKLSKPWWRYAVILAPVLFLASLVFSIIKGNYYVLSAVFMLNLALVYLFSKGINTLHNKLTGAGKVLNQYVQLFKLIHGANFTSAKLLETASLSSQASSELKKLSSIINFFDQRINMLVAIFFNAIFFYDLHCIMSLERWKTRNAHKVDDWFNTLAQIETLNSLATFAFNNEQYCMPQFTDGNTIVDAENLAHPLIKHSKSVSNDVHFSAQSKVILITGSNMSGKSTFLRTLGVNMVLASCGAPVAATAFKFYPVKIYTSLRQNDSLQEDTSFFYAELKKISSIVQHLQQGEQAIVLLDEVLRGTNSDDKTFGSHELILRLMRFNALTLIATHDISLGKMEDEQGGLIENHCFESTIINNELYFDYKLRKGVAVNKNATFLMRKMGIIN